MTVAEPTEKRILVIEDEAVIRDTMALILEMEGYQVAAAANGREALEYLHRAERPSLILLDLMMPVMDGWQFRREQRLDPRLAAIPVVIVSAAGGVAEKAADLGADGFLQKPVDVDELLTTIHRHC